MDKSHLPNIAVIGAGQWGQALYFALRQKLGAQGCVIASRTPRDIEGFVDLSTALQASYLVMTIPTQQVRGWLQEFFVDHGQKILVASKGIEANSGDFLNDIYGELIPAERLVFLSGPSFATEVKQGLPTALVMNSVDEKLATDFAAMMPSFIKIYTSTDVIGAEIAGAYKNVIAIASGICEGLGLGNNARASLITRGLAEMSRFGLFFGAKEQTFMGLSGVGDLCLTASSTMSRNFRVGLGLSQKKSLDQILAELGEVAEGVATAYAIAKLAQKHTLYLPIAYEVHAILEGKDPQESLKDLLVRKKQGEF